MPTYIATGKVHLPISILRSVPAASGEWTCAKREWLCDWSDRQSVGLSRFYAGEAADSRTLYRPVDNNTVFECKVSTEAADIQTHPLTPTPRKS